MKPVSPSESVIQRGIVAYLKATLPDCIVAAIPNASIRSASGRPGNAVSGLLAGVPDLMLITEHGKTFFMEVKTQKGRLSESQNAMLNRFADLRVPYVIVRSISDAREAVKSWNLKSRDAS